MKAVFVGYDIPLALDVKWSEVMPFLDQLFERIEYEGDTVRVVKTDTDQMIIRELIESKNEHYDIGLTLEFFIFDENLVNT